MSSRRSSWCSRSPRYRAEVLEETRALLMKLTGKRKIDETPAALHEVMEQLRAGEARARREGDRLGRRRRGFPRPTAFDEGKEALESVLALANPMHRVKEIHARAEDLKRGVECNRPARDVSARSGAPAFTELKSLRRRSSGHRAPPAAGRRSPGLPRRVRDRAFGRAVRRDRHLEADPGRQGKRGAGASDTTLALAE